MIEIFVCKEQESDKPSEDKHRIKINEIIAIDVTEKNIFEIRLSSKTKYCTTISLDIIFFNFLQGVYTKN